MRVDYDLTPAMAGRVTAYARISAALERPHAPEASVGLAFQPIRSLPISLAAERRIALGDGARDATALLAVGGFGPNRVGPSLEAEGYGQTGIVGLRARDPFVDGKLSLFYAPEGRRLRAGVSLSGGAQPDVSRLDIGPEIQLPVTVPAGTLRLSVEWRQRIAGQAMPASGLALTIGANF